MKNKRVDEPQKEIFRKIVDDDCELIGYLLFAGVKSKSSGQTKVISSMLGDHDIVGQLMRKAVFDDDAQVFKIKGKKELHPDEKFTMDLFTKGE